MDRYFELDELIIQTVKQGHTLECARQAIFPKLGEENMAPRCICLEESQTT